MLRRVLGGRVLGVVASVGVVASILTGMGAGSAAAAGPVVFSGMRIETVDTPVTVATCTLGAVITPTRAVTAGHCGAVGKTVYTRSGVRLGRITTNLIGRHVDIAVITLAPGVRGRVDALDYTGRYVRGQAVSKQGASSGFSASRITDPVLRNRTARGYVLRPPFLELQTTLTVDTQLHSIAGDSGSGVRSHGRVVGILSSNTANGHTAFAPLALIPPRLR